ncbi:hypothetical protein [Streptomyces vinaceus]|uniref:hypothetical protein n=1 Tax=Streptomyces vinaceus TaxID=1960 RepID=UPI00380E3016
MDNEIHGHRRSRTPGTARRAVLAPAAAAIAGALGLLWLAPDGPVPADGPSARAYRAVTEWVADGPGRTGTLLGAATEGTLVPLGLLLAAVGWRAPRRRDAHGIAGAALVGVGVVAAYVCSEAVKTLVDEERPCRAVRDAVVLAVCPEPGDWSFPSNPGPPRAGRARWPASGPAGSPPGRRTPRSAAPTTSRSGSLRPTAPRPRAAGAPVCGIP